MSLRSWGYALTRFGLSMSILLLRLTKWGAILHAKSFPLRWLIIFVASDSTMTFDHLFATASRAPSSSALASISSAEPPTTLSCLPPQILPDRSRAITLIPPYLVFGHQAASQFFLIVSSSGLSHLLLMIGVLGIVHS